jgi:hypothetical protein
VAVSEIKRPLKSRFRSETVKNLAGMTVMLRPLAKANGFILLLEWGSLALTGVISVSLSRELRVPIPGANGTLNEARWCCSMYVLTAMAADQS